jgi:cation transport ATPase
MKEGIREAVNALYPGIEIEVVMLTGDSHVAAKVPEQMLIQRFLTGALPHE